jgi:hypothetical protein
VPRPWRIEEHATSQGDEVQRLDINDFIQRALGLLCFVGSNLEKSDENSILDVLALVMGRAIGAVAVQRLDAAGKAPVYVVTEVDIVATSAPIRRSICRWRRRR